MPVRMHAEFKETATGVMAVGGVSALAYGAYYLYLHNEVSKIERLLNTPQEDTKPTRFMHWQMQTYPTARTIKNNHQAIHTLLTLDNRKHLADGKPFFIVGNAAADMVPDYSQLERSISTDIKDLVAYKEFLQGFTNLKTQVSESSEYANYKDLCYQTLQIQGNALIPELANWTQDQENRMYERRAIANQRNKFEDVGTIVTHAHENQGFPWFSLSKKATILWWKCVQRIARLQEIQNIHAGHVIGASTYQQAHALGQSPPIAAPAGQPQQQAPQAQAQPAGWNWQWTLGYYGGGAMLCMAAGALVLHKLTA